MNHPFVASLTNKETCAVCKHPSIAHGDEATCEVCNNIGPVELKYGNMLMCADCAKKEADAWALNNTPAAQQGRIDTLNASIEKARAVDATINVRTDLFNAATVSIMEIKKSIDEDTNIPNKPYALAEELTNRFNHYKAVIFEMNEKIVESANAQKAIQVYLNNLANSLRAEEREKLKLQDINYKPKDVKSVTPKAIRTSSTKKLDKVELRKYATELGVSEFILQTLVVSKGISVEQAANMLRKSINEAKSEVS